MAPLRTAAAAVALLLAGCAQQAGRTASDGHRTDVPVAKPVGEAVDCVPLQQLRDSRVRDDWTIDFRTSGNRWYRNTLPNRCNGLGLERAFSYSTSLTQLCSLDIITVIAPSGAGPMVRGSCGLGNFQPVELDKSER